MPATRSFGVFEIGMNHAGEIAPLSAMARPHVALITTIAPVHIEYFGSIEAIADAKAEIFLGLEPGGVAVLNRDAPQFERLLRKPRRSPRGRARRALASAKADAKLLESRGLAAAIRIVQARSLRPSADYRLGAPGRHIAKNSLARAPVPRRRSASTWSLPLAALALFSAQPGRGERSPMPPEMVLLR